MSQIKEQRQDTLEQRAERFMYISKEKHGETYDYSSVKYVNSSTKVEILCSEHGSFWQRPENHLLGQGCPSCAKKIAAAATKKLYRDRKEDFSHIQLEKGTRLIPLTKGKYAIVDEDDFDRVNQFIWAANFSSPITYARTRGQGKLNAMHRMVMNANDPNTVVDHIDHNGLNNRKSNLRICSQSNNCMNTRSRKNSTSKYKGVCMTCYSKKWVASIRIDGKSKVLGYFESEIEAAKAYDAKAIELHGEYAHLNFKQNGTV